MSTPASSATVSRGHWSSRFGFILAAAGSAIGLGNIWRFPYTAGANGGGAWVLLYLLFVLAIGVPVLLCELSVGRHTQRSPVSAFKALVPGTWWPVVGAIGVLAGFGILSFYSVIAGLTVGYVYLSLTGRFAAAIDAETSAEIFGSVASNGPLIAALTGFFLLATALIVRRGVSGGIERASRILMPIFFGFLVLLVVRALTLPGGAEGFAFMFNPDFSKMTIGGAVSALGQALFSLSLGMGAMITYGSYLSKDENIPISAASVATFDTSIAMLGGLIVFPTLFTVGASPTAGPGLIFVVMASIFNTLPLGGVFSVAFYTLLAIAALTSTISLLEVIVSYFVDDRGMARGKAAWLVAAGCFVLALPSALSLGAVGPLSNLLGERFSEIAGGSGFLDLANFVFGTIFLTVGAMLICIFVGWKWGIPAARAAIETGGHRLPGAPLWGFVVRYVCPLATLILLLYGVFVGSNW
ncbi:MAG: sodium-dependent transporter [Acidobacteriota bacterium]